MAIILGHYTHRHFILYVNAEVGDYYVYKLMVGLI